MKYTQRVVEEACEVCGEVGSRDIPCRCGRRALVSIHLGCLADNLRIAGGLCAAFAHGCNAEWNWSQLSDEVQWTPNTEGRTAPGWRES